MLPGNEDWTGRSRDPLVPVHLVRVGLLGVLDAHLEEERQHQVADRARERVGGGLPVAVPPRLLDQFLYPILAEPLEGDEGGQRSRRPCPNRRPSLRHRRHHSGRLPVSLPASNGVVTPS
jgi:hypothetical protein